MNRLYLLILLLASVISADGQSILDLIRSKDEIVKPRTEVSKVVDDAVYSLGTVKRNCWHYPTQIVDKKDIRNYAGIVRLSKKDNNGHFTRVEYIDGFGNLLPGAFTLAFQNIDGIDSVKIADESISTIMSRAAALEFISDRSGKNLIKERVLDSDGNLLFFTSVFYLRPDVIQTTAFDRFGAPLQCGKDSLNKPLYPVEMTLLDKWGYDSVTGLFDHVGTPLLNSDKALFAITANDSLGNVIRKQSADLDGNLIIDIVGNCGWEYEYDSVGNVIKASNRDEKWQPIRTVQGESEGTICHRYEYDKYNRKTRQYFVDSDGNPDTTVLGTHEIRFSYGPDYSTHTIEGVNLNGEPSPIYTDGRSWATETYRYENGKLVEYHTFDIDGKPYSDFNYYSSLFRTYDSHGNFISEENFVAEDGVEQLNYKNYNSPDSVYTRWSNGDYRIDLMDKKGRTISSINYSSDGALDEDFDTPKILKTYVDKKKRCRITEKYFDSNDMLDHIEITDIDSIAHAKDFYKLNSDNEVYESYRIIYDPTFNESLSQYNINSFGKLTKCGRGSDTYYSKAIIRHTPGGALAAFYCRDNAGNPDYYQFGLDDFSHIKLFRDDFSVIRFDIDNSIIDYFATTAEDMPQALSIEVTDPKAYSTGIRDNDIILQYGDYILDWNLRGYSNAIGYWALKSVLNADTEKELIVYRPENKSGKNTGSIVRIPLPKGTSADLGFKVHVLNHTAPQFDAINSTVAAYNASNPADTITSPEFFHYPIGSSVLGFLVPPTNLIKQPDNFNIQIGNPAFLTYVDHPGFIGFDCLTFDSLYNLIKISNFNKKQSERYGDDYVEPDYLANPTYYVTTGNGELKSFRKQADSRFGYCFFAPSSSDSLRLLNMPVLKKNPAPYFDKFSLDPDMPKEHLDSLYYESFDAYMVNLNELAANRMLEFARINYTPAYNVLALCYGYGWGVPLDYDLSKEYADLDYQTNDNTYGYTPLINHFIENGDFDSAEPYLKLMVGSRYTAIQKKALKILSDEYLSRADSITAFGYLNDYVALLDFDDESDENEIARLTTLYEESNNPIIAKGLLYLGFKYLAKDNNSKTGCSFISRCYDMDPLFETDELSINNVIYFQQWYCDNFDNYPAFRKFRDEHVVTVRVVDDYESQAASIGWSGKYYLLKFGDWDIYSNSSIFTDKNKYSEENIPFEVVLINKKGKIVSHTFTGKAGVYISVNHATPKEVRKIRKAYDKWSERQKTKDERQRTTD